MVKHALSYSKFADLFQGNRFWQYYHQVNRNFHLICNTIVVSPEPHFIKGDEDVCAEAQDEEDVGNGKGNHKVMTYIPDEPRGCQVEDDAHERDAIYRNLQSLTRMRHCKNTGEDKHDDGD